MRALIIFAAALVIIVLGAWATLVLYFDEDRLKAIATEQVRAQTGRELTISGPLDLRVFPRLALQAEDVRLSGPSEFDGPETFQARELRLSMRLLPLLRGRVETGAVALEDAEVRLHTDSAGRSSLDGLTADPDAEAPAERPAISAEQLTLTDVDLVVSDARTGTSERYSIDSLELDGFAFDTPVPFRFSGNLGEPPRFESLTVTGTLTVPSGAGPVTVPDLEVEAQLAGMDIGLGGRLRLEQGPPAALELADGALVLDGERHDLTFAYTGGPRPAVEARLAGGHLDLDRLLAGTGGAEDADAGEGATESPLAAFRDMDLDAALEMESMTLSGLELEAVTAQLTGRDGVLRADPVRGELPGGRVSATGRVDLNREPPEVQFAPAFELSDLGRALAPWGLEGWLEGAGDLSLEMRGRGLAPRALLASLTGSGRYDLRDGRIHGFRLEQMVDSLRDGDLAAAARGGVGGSTEFRRLSGPIAFKEGRMELSGIQLDTARLGVTGDVSLGLADLDLAGSVRFSGERLGRVPMAISGSLTEPRLAPDLGQAVQEEAGRRILDLLERRERDESGDEESADEDSGGDGTD